MKNAKRNTIILLLIGIVVTYFILKDNFESIVENLLLANKWLILLCFMLVIVYWLCRSLALYLVVKKYKKNVKFKVILHQTLITQFFNGITPFATGGEPMQVYMLTKSGMKVASATNVIVQEFIMYQIALVLIGFMALGLNLKFNFCRLTPVLGNMIIIGFAINIIIGLILIFVSFSKKFSKFIVKIVLKLGIKFKLIKDVEKTTESLNEKLEEYNESGSMLMKNKSLFIGCVLLNFIALIIFYIIPTFIFMSLGYDIGFMQVFVSSAFILLIGNFVPIPGGSVGIEGAYLLFFDKVLPSAPLNASLILWRSITYYFGIFVGGISLGFFKGDAKK